MSKISERLSAIRETLADEFANAKQSELYETIAELRLRVELQRENNRRVGESFLKEFDELISTFGGDKSNTRTGVE